MELDKNFWRERYLTSDTGWDIGGPSTPLREFADGVKDKSVRVLIPGAGRAYEAEYMHRRGFTDVHVIDLTDEPFIALLQRCPTFPKDHLIINDFFAHEGEYDIILEQTFFCALDPSLRSKYVKKMHELLAPGGKLVGVLFDDPLNDERPPFGGSKEGYMPLFKQHFSDVSMERCYNSIKPREERELWLRAVKDQ